MTAIITNKFRIQRAAQFKKEFSSISTEDNYYLYVGEPDSWQSPASDDIPPIPTDTPTEHRLVWQTMLGLKRIGEMDVSHVIPRFNWVSNTVFAAYSDNDVDLFNHPTPQEIVDANNGGYTAGPIYCIDTQFRIYKCLDNNNKSVSTVTPSGTSPLPFSTADGYTWQYMMTVSGPNVEKFASEDWMPVQVLTFDDGSFQWIVQQNAQSGKISTVKITNPGNGLVDVASGSVSSASSLTVVLSDGGNEFNDSYNHSTIHITSGTGIGQQRVITSYNATSKEVTVSEPFDIDPDSSSTYEIVPTVSISGDGTGAMARAVVESGMLTSVQVTNAGDNYTFANATVTGGNLRLGGTTPTVSVDIGPIGGHGANVVEELGARYVMMNVKLTFTEGDGDFPQSNEYRRLGIVFNPKNFGTNDSATALTLRATKQLILTGVSSDFTPDENISTLTSSAFLVESEDLGGGNFRLTYIQNESTGFDTFTVGDTLTGDTSGSTGIISSLINPEVEHNSGDILYMQNQRPISRQELQLEDIKLTIAF